jgi:microcystin-dependent protein
MSINNIENIAFNYLTNLTTINADEVNTDILTKSDPDISDLQFDMLEGINTNQTIQQQIDAIENQIVGLGASYWISVWDTTTQTNPAANTARIVTWNNSDPSSNGIVAGSSSGSIKVLHANVYNIQFSFQLHQTSSSTANVTIWLRKNGVDVPASAGEYDVKGNDHLVTAWNYVLPLAVNDYIQLYWASDSTSMTLGYQAAQTSPYAHPAIPSVIITVTNVTGEGPAGPEGPIGPQGPQGERGPRGFKGEPGSGSVDDVARALAGSALALATTAQATAILAQSTAAGAVAANGAQDLVIGALQDAVGTLQTKTQDMSWGTLTGTTFSRTVHVNNTGGGIGGDAVTLSSNSAADFLYGINNLKVTNSLSIDDYLYVSRNNRNAKKIVLYDGNSGDDYDYTGMWVNSSGTANKFNFEIDNDAGSNFGWYAGNGFGSGRSLLKEISSTREFSTVGEAVFLRQNAFTQNIRLVRDVSNSIVQMTMMGDKAGLGDYDGRIIQQAGNGLTDGTGTMIIESGTVNINSLVANTTITSAADTAITSAGQVNINANDEINIEATSVLGKIKLSTDINDIELLSAGGITASSGGLISITNSKLIDNAIIITTNTDANDITLTNATTDTFAIESTGILNLITGGILTIDSGANNTNITTTADMNIQGDNMNLTAGTTTTIAGTNEIEMNTALLDVNTTTMTMNSSGATTIESVGSMTINCDDTLNIATTSIGFDFNITAAQNLNLTADGTMTLNNTLADTSITTYTDITITATSGTASITANTGATLEADSGITAVRNTNGDIDILSYGNTEMTNGSFALVSSSTAEFEATSNILIASNSGNVGINAETGVGITAFTGDAVMTATTGDTNLYATAGAIDIQANNNVNIGSNAGNVEIDAVSFDAAVTTGNVSLQTNSGDITLSTVSGTGAINLQSNNGDVNVTATDIDINATTGGMLIRTGTGAIDVHAKANLDLHADTGDVNMYATDLAIYSTSGTVGITGAAGANFQTTDGNLTVLAGGSANTLFLSSQGETIITSQAGDLLLNANSSSYNLTMKVNNSTKLNMNTTTTTHSQNVQMNNNLTMASTSQFNFIPAGTIHMSVASAVPTGYLRCNGNAVSRSTYSVLFAAIGTTFGSGDGITTFNVPNFQGAFLRGQGNQTVGGVNYAAAAIGTAQQDQVLQTTVYATNEGFRDCAAGARECVARRRITADPVDTDTGILAQFQRQGTENRPMNYAVHYNIKF